jgi:hypothetical protein
VPEQDDPVCLADVSPEKWERYEQLAEQEGEPPDTEVPEEELV